MSSDDPDRDIQAIGKAKSIRIGDKHYCVIGIEAMQGMVTLPFFGLLIEGEP